MMRSFPWLALALGLLLALLLLRFSPLNTDPGPTLPLLTALLMSEFGFLVTAVGAGIGIRDLTRTGLRLHGALITAGNAVLALVFLRLGLLLWPDGGL